MGKTEPLLSEYSNQKKGSSESLNVSVDPLL
jgi:hypothetical protein